MIYVIIQKFLQRPKVDTDLVNVDYISFRMFHVLFPQTQFVLCDMLVHIENYTLTKETSKGNREKF